MRQLILMAFILVAAGWEPESRATDLAAQLKCRSVDLSQPGQAQGSTYFLNLETPTHNRENPTVLKISKRDANGQEAFAESINSTDENTMLTVEKSNRNCSVRIVSASERSSSALEFVLMPGAPARTIFANLRLADRKTLANPASIKLFCEIDTRFVDLYCPPTSNVPLPPERNRTDEMIAEEPGAVI